jgi:hypothetical protein
MGQGGCLTSPNGSYKACVQPDGQFLVTKKIPTSLEKKWKKISGSATDISVDASGNAFVRNKNRAMFHHDGKSWTKLSG